MRVGSLPLVAALCLGLVVVGCGGDDAPAAAGPEPTPDTVEVTTLVPETLVDTVSLTGQLEAENSVVVQPETAGVVSRIEFVEGKPVEKGDVLLYLGDDMERARVDEARAALRLAKQVYERENKLARRDASSLARMEETRAQLETARAQLQIAEIELERMRVRAPFDGIPGARLVAPGERVEDDTGLVAISAVDRLQLLFTVPETAVALARMGGEIQARVAAFPGESFAGTVFFVSPTIDPASRRLVLKAWIQNPDHRLKPGMFANVDVEVSKRHGALLVPEASMVYDRNGIYVWRVVEGDRVEKVPVHIGLRQAGRVEIVEGLSPGDRVVSAGTNKVMAGERVRAVAPAEPAS